MSVDGDHADAAVVIDVRHLELRLVVAFLAHQTPDAHALVGKRLLGYVGGRVEYIRIGVAISGALGARARWLHHRETKGRLNKVFDDRFECGVVGLALLEYEVNHVALHVAPGDCEERLTVGVRDGVYKIDGSLHHGVGFDARFHFHTSDLANIFWLHMIREAFVVRATCGRALKDRGHEVRAHIMGW